MRVFISWSKDRSRQLAEALRDWLKHVIQNVDPWISVDDLEKGLSWPATLAGKLDETDVGILCVTRENQNEPWLIYEAGALSKRFSKPETRVIPYLLGMDAGELSGPLAQLNAAVATESETLRLVQSINSAIGDGALPDEILQAAFHRCWPELKTRIEAIPDSPVEPPEEPSEKERLAQIERRLEQVFRLLERSENVQPTPNVDRKSDIFSQGSNAQFNLQAAEACLDSNDRKRARIFLEAARNSLTRIRELSDSYQYDQKFPLGLASRLRNVESRLDEVNDTGTDATVSDSPSG